MTTYPSDSKHGIVRADLFSAAMTSAAVADKDGDGDCKRETGHGEDELLCPGISSVGPGRHCALRGEALGGVEDGE